MKKIIPLILIATLIICSLEISAFALFGTGVDVISEDVNMVKTGLLGKKLTFTDGDFKSTFAITDFDSITVTKLPSSREGTLLLAGRRVKEGQKIKRRNLNSLVFIPVSEEIEEASFSFKLNGDMGCETVCRMRFIDRVNYAPKIEETSVTKTT